jgi:hypothetical protein
MAGRSRSHNVFLIEGFAEALAAAMQDDAALNQPV